MALNPSLANVGGVPYAAFIENDEEDPNDDENNVRTFVKRFNGTAWELVGSGPLNADPEADAYSPRIIGVGGVPHVIYTEDEDTFVKRFESGTWVEPDPGALDINIDAETFLGSVANVGGVLHAAWLEDAGDGATDVTRTFVKRLEEDDTWSQVGTGQVEAATTLDGGGTIAAVNGEPWVAVNQWDGDNYVSSVRRYFSNLWQTVDEPLNITAADDAIQPRLADVGGVPFVTWREGADDCGFEYDQNNNCQVYVKCLDCVEDPLPPGPCVTGCDPPPNEVVDPFIKFVGKVKMAPSSVTGVVSCGGAPCNLVGQAKVKVPPVGAAKVFRTKRVKRTAQPGQRVKVKVKFKKKLRRLIKRARAADKTVKATLLITLTDAAGGKKTYRKKARLKPPK